MAEYIDREAALIKLMQDGCSAKNLQSISDMPAADVAPVRHGKWLGRPICGNCNCRCSECGSWHHIHANLRGEIMQKYCPNCGAKMDETVGISNRLEENRE